MAKTLIARITVLKQYDAQNKSILYEDGLPTRWINLYNLLQVSDNAIFIGANRLLIGTISHIDHGKSILCTGIQEVICSNDQFLQLHEIFPEQISRVKASFAPFIHPLTVNIPQLIADANAKKFVSFYILDGINRYNSLRHTFLDKDRIVLLDTKGRFQNVLLNTPSGLAQFRPPPSVKISIEGLTPDEVLEKNKSIKRRSAKSNNVSRIVAIQKSLTETGEYKFNTFFSYYDALYNKRVYGDRNNSLVKIPLLVTETVYKVSMSSKDISEEAFKYFNDNNLVIVHSNTKAKGTSYQKQGDTFSKQMKIGDYFYICRGNSNFEIIGRITGDAEVCDYDDFGDEGWLQRTYELVAEAISESAYQGDKKWWAPNDNSTCIAIPRREINIANAQIFEPFFNRSFEIDSNPTSNTINTSIMKQPLNKILFGPPGTGKTFSTINRALEILGEAIADKTREEIKSIFDSKMKSGQIMFTTFHQSMSYEDFVEGIKPIEPDKEGQPLTYKVVDGLFKKICSVAAHNCYKEFLSNQPQDHDFSFEDLYAAFIDDIQQKMNATKNPDFITLTGKEVNVKEINSNYSIIAGAKNSVAKKKSAPLTKENMQKLYDKFSTVEEIKNLDQIRDTVQVTPRSTEFYALFKGLKEFEKGYEPDTDIVAESNKDQELDYDTILKNFNEGVYDEAIKDYGKKAAPVILIIDEINRGNISQILGELITLIEKDKRLGNSEALEITLPYSKKKFGVPPNLFIIGTMNTADRSVEALDAALRRRFSFEEMPPRPELVSPQRKIWELWWKYEKLDWENEFYKSQESTLYELLGINVDFDPDELIWSKMKKERKRESQIGYFDSVPINGVNLSELLTVINRRIEKLLDKDHQIGHSYFMSVASLDGLKSAFKYGIIPLLQEYFFGDYGKIGLVLGTGFFEEPKEEDTETFFAPFFDYEASQFAEKVVYKLKDITNMKNEDFMESIAKLLQKKNEGG